MQRRKLQRARSQQDPRYPCPTPLRPSRLPWVSLMRWLLAILLLLCVAPSVLGAEDALDEVNARRAARRLPPFKRCDCLTVAAKRCADYRAEHRIAGHTRNDFAYLPEGCHAEAAGCAGWRPGDGWGACCTYERWEYAGAAWAMGKNGVRYMHLYVSNRKCEAKK